MKNPFFHAVLTYALCATALVGYGFWYSLIEKKSTAVARLEDQIILKTETASRIASARASLAEIENDEAIIKSYFVPETGVVAFINDLEARGEKLGTVVDVLSVSMSNENTKPTLIFTLAVEGTFDAVMRTVGVVEFAPHALSISTLSLKKNADGKWRANLDLLVGSVLVNAPARTP